MRRSGNMTADIKSGRKKRKTKSRQSKIPLKRPANSIREMETFSSVALQHSTPRISASQVVFKRTDSDGQRKTATHVDNDPQEERSDCRNNRLPDWT